MTIHEIYLLAKEFHGDLGADGLQLPPLIVVEGFDLIFLIGLLDQVRRFIGLRFKNGHKITNPLVDLSLRLEKNRQQLHRVQHVENLGDQDHHFQLIWASLFVQVYTHHIMETLEEVISYLNESLALAFNLVLECPDHLFERSQADHLGLLVLGAQFHLDLLDRIVPVTGGKIGLRDVEDYVFKLRSKKAQN